jgi:pyruvate ferredoxin oxidoreductase gamma subunit
MYRIRFHGRGGQGMKTASRILGDAFFLCGYEVQDAPRYGAERRGAPIFAYVRAAKQPINERGVINRPDLVIVADDSLVAVPAAGVLQGIGPQTVLLINSHESPKTWKERLNIAGQVLILPVSEEVEDRTELPFLGTMCAGAAARLIGVISLANLQQAIGDELEHLGPEVVEKNIQQASTAYELAGEYAGRVQEGQEISAGDYESPGWVDLPFEAASISAPTIHTGLTSELAATGAWRTMRPVIDYQRCNRCWWVCSEFCPDGAIKVNDDGYPQIDLDHCKGCLVCVAQCPPHAIEAVPETTADATAKANETTGDRP